LNKKIFSILVTFLLLNQFSFAQKIEPGHYVSVSSYNDTTGETVYNYEFREEITVIDNLYFRYNYRDDNTNNIGFGKYKNGKKFLNLDFGDKPKYYNTSEYKIIDSSLSLDDSLKIEFTIKEKREFLIGARIEYSSNNTVVLKSGTTGNEKVRLIIPKQSIPGYFKISYVGCESILINIFNDYNKSISVNMGPYFKIIAKGKSITYRIKDVNDDGFYAIGGNFSKWTFFKRVN
jgi:hypothetical protein